MAEGKGTHDLGIFDDLRPPTKPSTPPLSTSPSASPTPPTAEVVDDADWDLAPAAAAPPAPVATKAPELRLPPVPVRRTLPGAPGPAVLTAPVASTLTPPAPAPISAPAVATIAAPAMATIPTPPVNEAGRLSSLLAPPPTSSASLLEIPLPPPAPYAAISSMAPPLTMSETLRPHRMIDEDDTSIRRPSAGRTSALIGVSLAAGLALGFVGRGRLAPSTGSQAEAATLKVGAGQPGVKLVVDGRDIGSLPRELAGLTPGEHVVSFEGDRYRARKATVTLLPHEVRALEAVSLEVIRGAASFDVKTQGAVLALVSASERREIRDWSRAIDVDNTQSWTLEASSAGFETQRVPVSFGSELAKTFVVSLEPAEKHIGIQPSQLPSDSQADLAANAPVEATSRPERGLSAEPAAKAAAEPAAKAAAEPAAKATPEKTAPAAEAPAGAAAEGNCTLNVNSIPPSKVVIDGRPVGITPKIGISVPSGQHTVLFVGENGRKSASTTCVSGEQKTVSTRL